MAGFESENYKQGKYGLTTKTLRSLSCTKKFLKQIGF